MKRIHQNVCRSMRQVYSGWIDCELELDTKHIEHLGACEACRNFVAFAQSTPALHRVQPQPIPPLATDSGWKVLAAGLVGFASVAPALSWLDRASGSSDSPTTNSAVHTDGASTTELALAVQELRRTTLSQAAKPGLSLTPSIRALQTLQGLTEKR